MKKQLTPRQSLLRDMPYPFLSFLIRNKQLARYCTNYLEYNTYAVDCTFNWSKTRGGRNYFKHVRDLWLNECNKKEVL